MGKDNGERLDETSGPAGLANDEGDVLDGEGGGDDSDNDGDKVGRERA